MRILKTMNLNIHNIYILISHHGFCIISCHKICLHNNALHFIKIM